MSISTSPIGALPIGAVPPYVVPVAATMGNLTLLSPRNSDSATMAAGSQVSSLPVGNLQTNQTKKVWRSGGTADYVTVSFAKPVAANMLSIDGHNLSGAGVLRVRGASTLAGTVSAPAVDTGWVSAWPSSGKPLAPDWPVFLSAVTWTNDAEYQYWRIDLADPALDKSYIQAGRLVLDRRWQSTFNFDVDGVPLGYDQKDIQVLTDYGQTFTDRRTKSAPRTFQLKFTALDRVEAESCIGEINRQAGMWGDVVCLLDPGATSSFHLQAMRGVFTTPQAYSLVQLYSANGAMYAASLNLREII